jgi:CubicO group peptidase (beta-lactamase class C family)
MAADFSAARAVLERAAVGRVFPAAVAEVGTGAGPIWQHALGRLSYAPAAPAATPETVFDLASLTKVLSTAALAMRQVEQGTLGLDDPVSAHVPSWSDARDARVTIRDLLSHASGLPAHLPLFERHAGREAFEAAISAIPPAYPPRTTSIYSDLGFILLGFVLERTAPLASQFDTLLSAMGLVTELQFQPPSQWRPRTAPAREDPWRGRLLVGEVDDNNASALGGVAGHAGLFGTADAVGGYARHLLQILDGRTGVVRRDTLQAFITRRTDVPGSSRALGWDTMLPTSSCGTRMSPRAFGHAGFTGTTLWIDPDRGVYVVLLTNRIHPTPDNDEILRLRPVFHDAVITAIDRGLRGMELP